MLISQKQTNKQNSSIYPVFYLPNNVYFFCKEESNQIAALELPNSCLLIQLFPLKLKIV